MLSFCCFSSGWKVSEPNRPRQTKHSWTPETSSKNELETSDTQAATAPKCGVTQQRPQQQSKYSGWCFFFAPAPPKSLQRPWAQQQESSARPGTTASKILETDNTRHETKAQQQKTPWPFSFPCHPVGPDRKNTCRKVAASNGASPSPAFRRGRSKRKKNLGGVCFCSGPVPTPNGASPSPACRRDRSKKKYPGSFFLWPRRKVAAPNGAQKEKHL